MQNIGKQKFLWGSATIVYQYKGVWDADGESLGERGVFPHSNPLDTNDATGDVSCDFCHHYKEDIGTLRARGQNAYRFSISWARILPNGRSAINQGGDRFL